MMAQYNTSVLAGTQQKGDKMDDVILHSANKRELTSCGLSKEYVLCNISFEPKAEKGT